MGNENMQYSSITVRVGAVLIRTDTEYSNESSNSSQKMEAEIQMLKTSGIVAKRLQKLEKPRKRHLKTKKYLDRFEERLQKFLGSAAGEVPAKPGPPKHRNQLLPKR